MKVIVATEYGQGVRKNDFCWVPEGEILHFGIECDKDRDDIDGYCGCRRAMVGLDCAKSTTTMKVAELPVKRREVFDRLVKHYREGWKMKVKAAKETARGELKDLSKIVASFPLGVVLEKRGSKFQTRRRMPKEVQR